MCPVCWSGTDVPLCRVCGHDVTDGATQLRSAAAKWDLHAASRASRAVWERANAAGRQGRSADRVLPGLRPLLRLPPPMWDEVPAPADETYRPLPKGPETWAGAVSVLTALSAGAVDAVLFLGISATGLTTEILPRHTDEPPAAHQSRSSEVLWTEVAPWLPRSTPERYFLLAGGIGQAPPYGGPGLPPATDRAWEAAISQSTDLALAALHAVRSNGRAVPLVVVHWAPGWRWLDAALRAVERSAPPAARIATDDGRAMAAAVSAACHRVPLRHGYALLTRPKTAGALAQRQIRPLLLFPGGTLLPEEDALSVKVQLSAAPGDSASTFALPLVLTKGPEPADWEVLRTGRTTIRPGELTEVTVVLRHAGQPRFSGNVIDSPFDEDLLLARPGPVAAPDVDLLLLLELGGTPADLDRRVGLLCAVLERLDADWSASGQLTVGAIGYGGHAFRPMRSSVEQDPLRYWGPGPALEAGRELKAWTPSPASHTFATPLEDALDAAARRDIWRPHAHRVLLIVGSRPPHPPQQGKDLALPCPKGLDWEVILGELRQRLELQVISVYDPHPPLGRWRRQSVDRLRHAWTELGRQHSFELGMHGPEVVAAGIRAAAGVRGTAPGLMVGALGDDSPFDTRTWHENEES
ncbi:hypothetical protein ABZ721_14265 [Streptomyces sp. NPDC006733]|uniref:hypothetical protein n=1 Tax=Streptomyces sp. NPDC006733 TaxID=3155460 RepID=UPI0033C076E6